MNGNCISELKFVALLEILQTEVKIVLKAVSIYEHYFQLYHSIVEEALVRVKVLEDIINDDIVMFIITDITGKF